MKKKTSLLILLSIFAVCTACFAGEWRMKQARLMTRWSEEVDPGNVLDEYPRPQMVREGWVNLNGVWDFARVDNMVCKPASAFDRKILVPFPMESAISGVMDTDFKANQGKTFGYRRGFALPGHMKDKRILLHFGAVDWECKVFVNGRFVGEHRGGFDPFYFDVTDAVDASCDEQEIQVFVRDDQEFGGYPHGKQKINEKVIWYTPTTGIWQTVWIEGVSKTHVKQLKLTPDLDDSTIRIEVDAAHACASTTADIHIYEDGKVKYSLTGQRVGAPIEVSMQGVRTWSPDSPYLYDLRVELNRDGVTLDRVESYFGMRKISLGTRDGKPCILLNNEFIFQYGPLDQGFWPDGIYTAPTDEALKYDLEVTKAFGMNMTRKHIKVEPARWYHHCDKMGLLVWQDIPNPGFGQNGRLLGEPTSLRENFHREMEAIMKSLYNYPSIVLWTIYNEGWGQPKEEESRRSLDLARVQDTTRLLSIASGWFDYEHGDIKDTHWYSAPNMLPNPTNRRASVCGEYGGITLMVDGHRWMGGSNMTYTKVRDGEEFTDRFVQYAQDMEMLQGEGLCAAVYTQLTDVEDEENGLMTYDRRVVKADPEQVARIRRAIERNYTHTSKSVMPVSQVGPAKEWEYFMSDQPIRGDKWTKSKSMGWQVGKGGFGADVNKSYRIGTKWKTPYIYIRRFETLDGLSPEEVGKLKLWVFHDEDCKVYINGVLAASLEGHVNRYAATDISPEALAAVKPGKPNLIAVECRQSVGAQFIDVGLSVADVTRD